jgi:hypothetical protein
MSNKEIKNCPICGGEADKPFKISLTGRSSWKITCVQYCISMVRSSKKGVIEDWNTRSNIPVKLSVDELRAQFEINTDIPSQIDWDGEDYMYYADDPDIKIMLDETRVKWYGWRSCARINDLIKDGE